MVSTGKGELGQPASPEATVINPVPAEHSGALEVAVSSRKQRSPAASAGVPMFIFRLPLPSPAASNTLPVTWSMAGYPSWPKCRLGVCGVAPSAGVKLVPSGLLFHAAPPAL